MSLINAHERTILLARLRVVGSVNLATIYAVATGEDATWTLASPTSVVAVQLLGLIGNDSDKLIVVFGELVRMFPNAPENTVFLGITTRLLARVATATADPTQELWIGSEPMVNRTKLRRLLKDILDGHNYGVVYVAGGNMSGRSHSFQLIRHVARSRSIPFHKIDFGVSVESRNLQHIYDRLNEAYGLNAINAPAHEGATPGDVAVKFALQLRSRLVAMPNANPKPWVVIDYTDDVPDPAVPEFLRMFCAARDANDFDNCVVFVLGPTEHLDVMRFALANMEVEELGDIYEQEIHDTAVAVNQRGGLPLPPHDLQARAADIFNSVQTLPTDAKMPALRRALVELRREVRAQ